MKIKLNLMDKAATIAAIEQAYDKGVPTGFIQTPERDLQTGLPREIYIEVDDNPDNPVNAIRKARQEAEAAKAEAAQAREAAQAILRMAGPDKAAIQATYDAVLTIAPEEPNAAEGAAAIADEPVVQNMSAVFIAENAVYREVKREDGE